MKGIMLPYEIEVESVAYQSEAFALGMIKPNIQHYDQWLSTKYINFMFDGNFVLYGEDLLSIKDGLCIKTAWNMIYEAFQAFCPDLIQKNKQMLEQGYYILGTFDEFYIPGKFGYKNRHRTDSYLIYGYDDDSGVFKAAGYLDNGKYECYDITYNNYHASIACCKTQNPYHQLEYIHINSEYRTEINISRIKTQLTDILNSSGQTYPRLNTRLGIQAGKYFEEYISEVSEIDMRYMRTYLEHKSLMDYRIKYLLKNGYIANETIFSSYAEVFQRASQAFNIYLEYLQSGNADLRKQMLILIKEANEKEPAIIELLEAAL